MQGNKKNALITGINGQDGSYLTEFLSNKGYNVYGILKKNSVPESQTTRISEYFDEFPINLFYADLTDWVSLFRVIEKTQPHEIYNLAAQSHVKVSFDQPHYTTMVNALGVLNILEAIRYAKGSIKLYQASSSEMFGNNVDADGFQRESTPMNPVSPYGCAKLYAYNICRNYRNAYKLFVSNGILFNHESPKRATNFVTNKVVKTAVEIKKGLKKALYLGNMDACRDWGHAKDYVRAMWLMLQQREAEDFVCATGQSYSVKDLVQYVFSRLDMDWEKFVVVSEKYYRPEELNRLKGDASKLKQKTGWKENYNFHSMLDEMIDYWNKII